MSKKKHPALRLKEDWTLVIPKGTLLKQWPVGSMTFEHVVGIHKDTCAYIRVDVDASILRPDLFEKVQE